MISALLYLQYHSLRNRLTARIKRLRQPKYLAAAIVGGIYFYFYFFRFLFGHAGSHQALSMQAAADYLPLLESLGALVLFVVVFMSWLIPHERAALTFTEAEIAFLFPAPINRRGLIHYKLLRSQIRILFSVLVFTLLSRRLGGEAWIRGAGWWLVFSTLNLHFLGASFTRTRLLDRGISNRLRRLLVLGIALAGAMAVVFWARRTMPDLPALDFADLRATADRAHQYLNAGPALYLLYPFRLLVRPFLSPDLGAFCLAAAPALLLFALHYGWVIRSNVAFEEASVEASQKLASTLAARRSGNWDAKGQAPKARKPLFKLAPTGPPSTALFWKNLVCARRVFSPQIWISLAVMIVFALAFMDDTARSLNAYVILTIVTAFLLVWSVLIGPQIFRQDLRQDLALADALKSYPMRGWQIVLGELLAPAAILSFAQWLILLCGNLSLAQARSVTNDLVRLDGMTIGAVTLGAAVLLPLLDLILLLIPNAAVLLFPSWIQHGRDAPRGVEALGQRLIFMLGQMLAFGIAIIPAALAFALVFILARLFLGNPVAIVMGSLATAVVLAAETALGIMLLGRLFERFDLSQESNA